MTGAASDVRQQLAGMSAFGELLHIAGGAAANSSSSTLVGISCREADLLGKEWMAYLPNAKAQLAEAIISAIHALVAAPTPELRTQVGKGLRELVIAGRSPIAFPQLQQRTSEPRRYWIEADS